MQKLYAILRLIGAFLLALMALATTINLVFITTRPETISVINAIIGLGLLAICLAALATVQFRKGLRQLREDQPSDSPSSGL